MESGEEEGESKERRNQKSEIERVISLREKKAARKDRILEEV